MAGGERSSHTLRACKEWPVQPTTGAVQTGVLKLKARLRPRRIIARAAANDKYMATVVAKHMILLCISTFRQRGFRVRVSLWQTAQGLY